MGAIMKKKLDKLIQMFTKDAVNVKKLEKELKKQVTENKARASTYARAIRDEGKTPFGFTRELLTFRFPLWLYNKALMKAVEHGGIGYYFEHLVIQDLNLEPIQEQIEEIVQEKLTVNEASRISTHPRHKDKNLTIY